MPCSAAFCHHSLSSLWCAACRFELPLLDHSAVVELERQATSVYNGTNFDDSSNYLSSSNGSNFDDSSSSSHFSSSNGSSSSGGHTSNASSGSNGGHTPPCVISRERHLYMLSNCDGG